MGTYGQVSWEGGFVSQFRISFRGKKWKESMFFSPGVQDGRSLMFFFCPGGRGLKTSEGDCQNNHLALMCN